MTGVSLYLFYCLELFVSCKHLFRNSLDGHRYCLLDLLQAFTIYLRLAFTSAPVYGPTKVLCGKMCLRVILCASHKTAARFRVAQMARGSSAPVAQRYYEVAQAERTAWQCYLHFLYH